MSITKKMGMYIGLFLIVLSFLTYVSRDSNNYILISNNREDINIFNNNKERISMYKISNGEVERQKLSSYLNGFIAINLENTRYLVRVKEKESPNKIFYLEKDKKPLDFFFKYFPKEDLRRNSIFLNSLTITFFLYNLKLLYVFKKEILKKKELIFAIILLAIKVLLTNSKIFSNIFLTRVNLLVTVTLGLYLLLFVKNKITQLREDLFAQIFFKILFGMYILGEVIMNSCILNPKILNYLASNYPIFLKISTFMYIWIDSIIIILVGLFLESIKRKKKRIIKEIEKKNLAMLGSFILLSLCVEIFVSDNEYFYYLNMFEFVFVFWYIFLTDINTMGRAKVLTIKVFQMFLHVYLFFVVTESVWIALGIVFSFSILNLYTYFITGTLRVNKPYIENLLNRMYLTKNYKEFKEQLSNELKKNLELIDVETKILISRDDYKKFLVDREYDEDEILLEKSDILNQKYDYALRLKYSKNPFVGLILIENRETKLVYEEKRYLEDISEQLSLVANRYRFERLQEELN